VYEFLRSYTYVVRISGQSGERKGDGRLEMKMGPSDKKKLTEKRRAKMKSTLP